MKAILMVAVACVLCTGIFLVQSKRHSEQERRERLDQFSAIARTLHIGNGSAWTTDPSDYGKSVFNAYFKNREGLTVRAHVKNGQVLLVGFDAQPILTWDTKRLHDVVIGLYASNFKGMQKPTLEDSEFADVRQIEAKDSESNFVRLRLTLKSPENSMLYVIRK